MVQDAFAGKHTQDKLDALERYLQAYVTVLKKQSFKLVYFDAFAGTGEIPFPSDQEQDLFPISDYESFVDGSIKRALKYSFSEFYFIEKIKRKSEALKEYCDKNYPDRNIIIQNCDANDGLIKFVDKFNSKTTRAIVFLDPFGNQVSMDMFRYMATKSGLDIWYLFPAGLGVQRQIGKFGDIHDDHGKSLDRLFGDEDWRNELVAEVSQSDLFGETITSKLKQSDPEKITKLMINRLKVVFEGRVVDDWLPLGPGNHHWYSLLFMWSNPMVKATLAGKLASAVLARTKRSRRR